MKLQRRRLRDEIRDVLVRSLGHEYTLYHLEASMLRRLEDLRERCAALVHGRDDSVTGEIIAEAILRVPLDEPGESEK